MSVNPARPTVSVCIPAYNEERNIGALLRFLRDSSTVAPRIVEVLVDISGSTDRTPEVVRELAAEWDAVRIIDCGRRDGLLQALDRLMGQTSGDVVVRMDADVQMAPDGLERMVRHLDDPGVGIVGARIRPARGRSRWVNLICDAEWEAHHQVCLRSPKTTVVQVFRWGVGRLPSDSGLEDAALQQCVERSGRVAYYDPECDITIMPPATVRGLLQQRVRTILHIRNHLRRGYTIPSTASVKLVADSLTATARQGPSLFGLFLFLSLETSARAMATYRAWFTPTTAFRWDPVEGTKDLDWASVGPVAIVERARPAGVDRF